jgi:hypothetical protein
VSIYKYLERFDDIGRLLKDSHEISDSIEARIGPLKIKKMLIKNNI